MMICLYPYCAFNREHQCTASDTLTIDQSGRCSVASQGLEDTLETILEFLERMSSYPFDEDKDREFFQEVLCDFPGLDVLEQLKAFQAWVLDLTEERKLNYRSTLRKWMKRSFDRLKKDRKPEKDDSAKLKRIK